MMTLNGKKFIDLGVSDDTETSLIEVLQKIDADLKMINRNLEILNETKEVK